jgi:tetratricopeptide (TPR) repeat protein
MLADLFPSEEQLSFMQGIESQLLRRKRRGTFGGIAALGGAIIQILLLAFMQETYIDNVTSFFRNLMGFEWGNLLTNPEFIGILVLVIGLVTYIIFRWTSFLLKESEEPFRYTFWIKPFTPVAGSSGNTFKITEGNWFNLLHHDLMERLNERIRRFSLLDDTPEPTEFFESEEPLVTAPATQKNLTSHIHIEGHYALREVKKGEWVIHVMPRVRIGPPECPETLAYPVKFPVKIKKEEKKNGDDKSKRGNFDSEDVLSEEILDADEYNQIVERVYSSIATEIYRQVEVNVKEKMSLFPTPYRRAVAFFYEAEDFARSNTIDAYDHAIKLYREARRYFNISNIKHIAQILLKCPGLWRTEIKFVHMYSRIQIGYAKCLIYRREISALTGRRTNPLFEIPSELEKVIGSIEGLYKKVGRFKKNTRLNHLMAFLTYPKDSWFRYLLLRPPRTLFEEQRQILFDAHVVNALTHYFLGAVKKARESLNDAKAIAPEMSERNALYLLAAGAIESDLDKEILLFRKATEIAPDFQIAQFLLAHYSNMQFRKQNEIVKARAKSVMKEYDEVLKINPGNIAALAAQGYLIWLQGDLDEAKKKFKEGCEVKANVRETFIGELNYGLARIAAEEGDFDKSYDLFTEAILADPGVGAYSVTSGSRMKTSYYDYIASDMLRNHYEVYMKKVLNEIKKREKKIKSFEKSSDVKKIRDRKKEEVSLRTLNIVRSFVLNDYGNACLNYFHRFGDPGQLDKAIKAFEEATKHYSDNAVAYYNLHNAYGWRREASGKIFECLDKAEKLAPAWPVVLIASAETRLRYNQQEIRRMLSEAKKEVGNAERIKMELKNKENLFAKSKEKGVSETEPKDAMSHEWLKFEAQEKIQKHTNKAINLYHDAKEKGKKLAEKYVHDVLPKVNEIVKRTKLSSMFEKLEFEAGGEKEIDRLLSKKIEKDRLDENDVEAMRVCAEVLANNYQIEKTFRSAEKLSSYILENFYPDNYDINMILRDMYMRKQLDYWLKLKLEGEENYGEKLEECNKKIRSYTEVIKPAFENQLDQDPIHYASLMWVPEFFEGEKLISFFDRAIESGPELAVYHANLGNILRGLNKWGEAERAYRKAVKLEPDNAGYLNILGVVYYKEGDYRKAEDCYTKAIKKDRKVAVYYANLADALGALGKWEDAEKAYQEAVDIEPDNPVYRNNLGNTFYQQRNYEKAIGSYKKAIKKNPQVAVYRGNLGLAFKESGKEKEAEKAYKQAIDIEPGNPFYLNGLGNAFYSRKNYERAAEQYLKAVKINPEVEVYLSNLILACEKLEDSQKAVSLLKSASEIVTDKVKVTQVIEKLKKSKSRR